MTKADNAKLTGKNKTLMGSIYDRLRSDLVDGNLRPGSRLRFDELKASYNIGLSPLREALTRLASENLVVLEENKGFRVAPISRSDLMDLLLMRTETEALGIRRSIERGDDQWESGVVAAIHALSKLDGLKDDGRIDPEWEIRHRNFHDSLVAACDSPRLLLYRQHLTDHADRYRRLSHHYSSSGRDHLAEHCALSDAVVARDTESANYLIRNHLSRTVKIILSDEDLQKTGLKN